MKTLDELFEGNSWWSIHDAVVDVLDVSITKEQAKEIFQMLPSHIQGTAISWGMSDTVFGDEVYSYVEENPDKFSKFKNE